MKTPISKRKREKFNTACVVFDEETGNLFFGRNGGIDRFGPELHPILKALLPDKPVNDYPTSWNCAETDAINTALYAGGQLCNFHIYTIDVSSKRFGQDKISCPNCTIAYKGRIKNNNTGWFEED